MRDITYCSATDCPSKECRVKVLNNYNTFLPGEIISMADFRHECRFYTGWMVSEMENENANLQM